MLFLDSRIKYAVKPAGSVELAPKLDKTSNTDVTAFIQGLLKDGYDRGFSYAQVTSRESLAKLIKDYPDKLFFVRVVSRSSYERYGTYGPEKPFLEAFRASDVATSGRRLMDFRLKETMETTGYPNRHIEQAMSGNKDYVVKVFEADPKRFSVVAGTWDNIRAIANVDKHLAFEFRQAGFTRNMDSLFNEVQANPMANLSAEGRQFRHFLEKQYGLNEIYNGNLASTISENGQAGLKEYLVVPTDQIGSRIKWRESEFRPYGGMMKYSNPADHSSHIAPSLFAPSALPRESLFNKHSLFPLSLGLMATLGRPFSATTITASRLSEEHPNRGNLQ